MESIGQKLVSARESLGFSIEQIARETNIAKSYLTALETENYDSFPGETYVLGFLRNYSEFLGLDPQEMINLYHNFRIQEQPAPMEELLVQRKPLPRGAVIAILVILLLAIGAAGYFLVYPNFIAGRNTPAEEIAEAGNSALEKQVKIAVKNTYEFADEVLEKRFDENDAVSVLIKENSYQLVIAEIGEKARFIYPQGELEMAADEEALLDLDGDSSADIRLLLRSLNPGTGSLVLHLDRFVQSEGPREPAAAGTPAVAESPAAGAGTEAVSGTNTGRAGAPSRVVDTVVIREAEETEPFTLNIIFRGYCLFRYEQDGGERVERYFHKGETFRLDADSAVSLRASNAGALAAKVNGVDISLGGSGAVTARRIQWEYNRDRSVYELQLVPVY